MQCTIITTKGRPFLPLCGQDVHSVEECQLYEAWLSPSVYYSVIAIEVKDHILSPLYNEYYLYCYEL